MATPSSYALHFFLLFTLLFSSSLALKYPSPSPNPNPNPHGFVFPIEKDPATLQYSTSITMGTPPVSLSVVIDLRERFLWFECGKTYNSSTYKPVHCGTKKCKLAKGTDCITCTNHPLKTGCTNNTCGVEPFNPYGEFFVSGDVGEDILSNVLPCSKDSIADGILPNNGSVPRFMSSCVYPDKFGVQGFLQGLAKGKKGVLGLARTAMSLPTQLAVKYKLHRKFALCLPSNSKENGPGNLFVGGGPYFNPPPFFAKSKLLSYTPLLVNKHSTGPIFDNDRSTEYFIAVKSIKIDDRTVKFNSSLLLCTGKHGHGGTKLSTVTPFTKLHTVIYRALVEHFVKQAAVKKIKRVEAVVPFEACFDASTIGKSSTGPDVPLIDLMLAGGVKWRIYGANSMVKVDENVLCLGFVDGGLVPEHPIATSIVIGAHQLEDNLIEFDLASSKLGFSSSLLLHQATCSSSH